MANEDNERWICTTIDVDGGIRPGSPIKPVMRGVAAKDKRWQVGTTLNVFFLSGYPGEGDNFMDIAKDWFLDGVNLKLGQTTDISKSHIRVDLKFPPGVSPSNESYIGTDSLKRANQWTLRVAKVTPDRVLHEFGHALGLNHEHSHSRANIPWNKEQVYRDLGAPTNNWTRAQVDEFVFEKFDKDKDVIITDFDIRSVMMYPIWPNWTMDGESFSPRAELSDGDKATIRKLYPA